MISVCFHTSDRFQRFGEREGGAHATQAAALHNHLLKHLPSANICLHPLSTLSHLWPCTVSGGVLGDSGVSMPWPERGKSPCTQQALCSNIAVQGLASALSGMVALLGHVPGLVAQRAVGQAPQPGMPELVGFGSKALGSCIWQRSWVGGSGWGQTLVSPAASRQLSSMRVGGKSEVFVPGREDCECSPSAGNWKLLCAGPGLEEGRQPGCSALLLLPRPKGWFIFRSKT